MSAERSFIDGMFGVDEILTPDQMFQRLQFVDPTSEAKETATIFANNALIDNQMIRIVSLTEETYFLELFDNNPSEQ